MAPHLTLLELDKLRKWSSDGLTPIQMHARLKSLRDRRSVVAPNLTNIRKVLKGNTYRLSKAETRGRKKALTRAMVRRLNATRKRLAKEANGEYEVHWADVIEATPGMDIHRTNAAKYFIDAGIPVKWRTTRTVMPLKPGIKSERAQACAAWRFLPLDYFETAVDLIMDNKRWDVPTTDASRKHLQKHRVRGHLRTPAEGMKPEYTKPSPRKHRINAGGSISLCAGIANGKIVLWEYLSGRWNGEAAAKLYKGPILKALRKHRGRKSCYKILEDNDPRGYKSSKARAAKKAAGIKPMPMPRYSPDLMPLDYTLWEEIENRMVYHYMTGKETVDAFKKRLRSVAMRLPHRVITKALRNMKKRILAIHRMRGGRISID